MELNITDFGMKLKICRVSREWSQDACAEQLGICRQTWINWELNRKKPHKYLRRQIKKMFPEFVS